MIIYQHKYYTVYKTTNLVNGKFYIGQHRTNNLDDGYLGSGKVIKHAIKKYGKENFKKEILFVFDNFKDMNNKEKELIDERTNNTYNLQGGGAGRYIPKCKDDTRVKMSKAHKGNFHSKETCKKMSITRTGLKRKPFTKEAIKNMSESRKGKIFSGRHKEKISLSLKGIPKDKTIYIFKNKKTGEVFSGTQLNFRKKNNMSPSIVSRLIKNKIKNAGNWQLI